MNSVKIISLGGSIVSPQQPDADFLKSFYTLIDQMLIENPSLKLILVVGGGGPARTFQKAYRDVSNQQDPETQDWIGIAATRLNAQLVASIFSKYCKTPVVTDPTARFSFKGRILVAAGWKPGFSTDNDAVILAKRFKGDTVINLSNIAKIYTDDPKVNPKAVPLDKVTWNDFKKIIGDQWVPGKNVPFDPVATKLAAKLKLRVIAADGKNLNNLEKILKGLPFEGTEIS